MAPWLTLTEISVLALVVCLVHSLQDRWGLAPLYACVGLFEAMLFFTGQSEPRVQVELFGVVSDFSYTLFLPALLVSVAVVYVLEGTRAARRLIAAIIVLYLLHGVLALALEWHAANPLAGGPDLSGLALVQVDMASRMASLVAIVVDIVVIIVVYQALVNRLPKLPLGIPLYVALVAGMSADAVVYQLIKGGAFSPEDILLEAKLQAGMAAGLPTSIYFHLQLRGKAGDVRRGILERAPLEILDLRRRVIAMATALGEQRERYARMRETFSQYTSPEVVDVIMSDPSKLALGGEERVVTVMFADIRGYSSLSEVLDPAETISLLNRYFGTVTEIILQHKGLINEFEGDAVMAVWGAPLDLPDHADLAVHAATEMLDAVEGLNVEWEEDGTMAKWREAGIERFEVRIGIHTGPVVAGNVGSVLRRKYTVIGDTVNTASRVEHLNKRFGTRLLLTSTTRDALTKAHLADAATDRGTHTVKGREQPVWVFSLGDRDRPALPEPEALPAASASEATPFSTSG